MPFYRRRYTSKKDISYILHVPKSHSSGGNFETTVTKYANSKAKPSANVNKICFRLWCFGQKKGKRGYKDICGTESTSVFLLWVYFRQLDLEYVIPVPLNGFQPPQFISTYPLSRINTQQSMIVGQRYSKCVVHWKSSKRSWGRCSSGLTPPK